MKCFRNLSSIFDSSNQCQAHFASIKLQSIRRAPFYYNTSIRGRWIIYAPTMQIRQSSLWCAMLPPSHCVGCDEDPSVEPNPGHQGEVEVSSGSEEERSVHHHWRQWKSAICLWIALQSTWRSGHIYPTLHHVLFLFKNKDEFNSRSFFFWSSFLLAQVYDGVEHKIYSWRNLQKHITATWWICLFLPFVDCFLIWLRKWGSP